MEKYAEAILLILIKHFNKLNKTNTKNPINQKKLPGDSDRRYQTLFDLSPGGIILEDLEGNIVDVNPALCKWLGYKRKELIGQKIHILAHPEHVPEVDDNITKLNQGKTLKHSVRSLRKDGTECHMDLIETKITLPDGKQGILSAAKDITDQKCAEEEKLKKEKMESIIEIAGAVCHEMNQPLTVLTVVSDLLLMNDFDKKETAEKLDTIKEQINRMTEMTHKLMNLTKYETREYITGTKIIDINKAAE